MLSSLLMKLFLILTIVAFITPTLGFSRVKKPMKKKAVLNVSQFLGPCHSAKECVSVRADACGCTSGGSNRAVLKKKLNAYEKSLRQYLLAINQKNEVCLALYMCSGEPNKVSCVNGKCVLR